MAKTVINQTTREGHGPCPDCGERADIKTIQSHDPDGYPRDGQFICISCPNCDYYEFYFDGPDI